MWTYFLLHSSFGCSVNIYTKEVHLFCFEFELFRAHHIVTTVVNAEHKKASS